MVSRGSHLREYTKGGFRTRHSRRRMKSVRQVLFLLFRPGQEPRASESTSFVENALVFEGCLGVPYPYFTLDEQFYSGDAAK